MSIGNLKDQGNKGNNFPYQLKTLQLLGAINTSINAIPGVDFVTRTTTYSVTNANPGQYNLGDILVRYDIIDIVTNLVVSTIWFNQTQGTNLLVTPLVGDYIPITPPSTVFVGNLGLGAAVNIQDGGNVISIDDAGGSITVDGIVTAVPTGTQDVNITSTISLPVTDNGGSLTVDSTNLDIRNLTVARDTVKIGDASHTMIVNPDGSLNITDNGTSLTVDGTVSVNGTVSVAGEVEIVNATGSPIPVTIVTPVPVINVNLDATDDQVGVYGYVNGVSTTPVPLNVNASGQVAIQGTLTGSNTTGVSGYTATAITDLVARDIIAAPGVGLFTYVTQILVTNSHATVGTLVTIRTEDGTGLYAGYAGPAGGGFSVSFTVPIKMPVANKKLQAICGTTGANVYVSASGYTAL